MVTDVEVLAALDDRSALALTAWAEARQVPRDSPHDHSPVEELIAVMVVARNRLARPGRWRAVGGSYKAICLAPQQFSCWNAGVDANHLALMAQARVVVAGGVLDPLVRECVYLASGVITGNLLDRTNGATSYWAPAAMVPRGRVPTWAVNLPAWQIGDQLFVKLL